MYKITSLVFGKIIVGNKTLGYGESIIVNSITSNITELQGNKIIKVTMIPQNPVIKPSPTPKLPGGK